MSVIASLAASLVASLASVFLFLPQESAVAERTFSEFSFCRQGPRVDDPMHCIRLNEQGQGAFTLVRSGVEQVEEPLELSGKATGGFLGLLEATGHLREAHQYESGRRVANLGRKTLALEGEWGRREGIFNYSDYAEVNNLVAFLDRLIAQETLLLELDFAAAFNRLVLPTILEGIREELRANRIPDPPRLLGALRRIGLDSRVVNYARAAAQELIEDIERR
jgi:hypothetical protein